MRQPHLHDGQHLLPLSVLFLQPGFQGAGVVHAIDCPLLLKAHIILRTVTPSGRWNQYWQTLRSAACPAAAASLTRCECITTITRCSWRLLSSCARQCLHITHKTLIVIEGGAFWGKVAGRAPHSHWRAKRLAACCMPSAMSTVCTRVQRLPTVQKNSHFREVIPTDQYHGYRAMATQALAPADLEVVQEISAGHGPA